MSSAACAVCHYGCMLHHTCLLTHPSSFLFRNQPTQSTMSTSNKSTSINVSDIPRFTRCNFQAWKDKMVGVFMISKVYDIVKGDTTKLDETKCPKMPSTPPLITGEMSNTDAEKAACYWTQFNVQMNQYLSLPHLFLPDSRSPVGFLLDSYQISTNFPKRHFHIFFHVPSYWTPTGLLLDSYWTPAGL